MRPCESLWPMTTLWLQYDNTAFVKVMSVVYNDERVVSKMNYEPIKTVLKSVFSIKIFTDLLHKWLLEPNFSYYNLDVGNKFC